MAVHLLCINSGSSSLKFALYQLAEAAETSLADGMIERIGLPGSHLQMRTAATAPGLDEPPVSYSGAAARLLETGHRKEV